METGRGWVRVLKSAITDGEDKLPKTANLEQLRDFWVKNSLNGTKIDFAKETTSFELSFQQGLGGSSTISGVNRSKPPPGFESLFGPWGNLEFETLEGDGYSATKVQFHSIFWVEAQIEDTSVVQNELGISEEVVRIELADERILWGMGGYVTGSRNRTINDVSEAIGFGKILQWDPSFTNPSKVNDISDDIAKADRSRPILDPFTIHRNPKTLVAERPHTTIELLLDASFDMAGFTTFFDLHAKGLRKTIMMNVEYGGATLSKKAFADIVNRYNLIIARPYLAFWGIYNRGQKAIKVGSGPELASFDDIPKEFRSEKVPVSPGLTMNLAPVSVEIVGDKIIEEVMCPVWTMVMQDDGFGPSGKVGTWLPAIDLLAAWGIDFTAASRAILASYDKGESRAFDGLFTDPKSPTAIRRKKIMRDHFFKSFMVGPGPVRHFLPMITKRAQGATHALNFKNMAIQRDAIFYVDGFTPAAIRQIGISALWENSDMGQLPAEDIKSIDEKVGVITFREPMGKVSYRRGDFSFISEGGPPIPEELHIVEFKALGEELNDRIAEAFDTEAFRSSAEKGRQYRDDQAVIRKAMRRFLEDNGVSEFEKEDREIFLNNITIGKKPGE